MAKFYDTLLGEYITNPGVRGLGLDKLANSKLDYQMISYDEISMKKKLSFNEVDLKSASIYSGEDVYITHKIFETQKNKDNKVLNEIEIPLLSVLKTVEINGVKIDRNILEEIGVKLKKEIEFLEAEIYIKAGSNFNINSPKQVGEILFSKLELPKGKKTKTGWSVNAEVLINLSKDYPIANDIIEYRHYSKILSTYINGITELLDSNDIVHSSFNQAIASTGRLSSTSPNLQNIPGGDGLAGEVRAAFISRFNGGNIVAFDYSQVEVRLLALLSEDANLLDAFNNDIDIHSKTGEFLFGKKEISSSERKIAKAVNFGVIYGISAFGLSKMIDISVKESKIYIDKFFESYPKVRFFLDDTIKNCESKGYVETMFGRKRYIPGINDRNKMIKSGAEREATNMPIQGTSADIIKIAMIKVDTFLKNNNFKSIMIMQVHDELVFDVFPGEEEKLKTGIINIMENIIDTDKIKLKVDLGIGKSRKEAK